MTGPFGNYPRMSTGDVLNALFKVGVPDAVITSLSITSDRLLKDGKVFAYYKYFDGIEQPLFRFTGEKYKNIKDRSTLEYMLSLSPVHTPGLVIQGEEATPEIYDILIKGLTNYISDPFYKLKVEAAAFFQGGYGSPNGKWFFIEFWNPKGAQAWVDAINKEINK